MKMAIGLLEHSSQYFLILAFLCGCTSNSQPKQKEQSTQYLTDAVGATGPSKPSPSLNHVYLRSDGTCYEQRAVLRQPLVWESNQQNEMLDTGTWVVTYKRSADLITLTSTNTLSNAVGDTLTLSQDESNAIALLGNQSLTAVSSDSLKTAPYVASYFVGSDGKFKNMVGSADLFVSLSYIDQTRLALVTQTHLVEKIWILDMSGNVLSSFLPDSAIGFGGHFHFSPLGYVAVDESGVNYRVFDFSGKNIAPGISVALVQNDGRVAMLTQHESTTDIQVLGANQVIEQNITVDFVADDVVVFADTHGFAVSKSEYAGYGGELRFYDSTGKLLASTTDDSLVKGMYSGPRDLRHGLLAASNSIYDEKGQYAGGSTLCYGQERPDDSYCTHDRVVAVNDTEIVFGESYFNPPSQYIVTDFSLKTIFTIHSQGEIFTNGGLVMAPVNTLVYMANSNSDSVFLEQTVNSDKSVTLTALDKSGNPLWDIPGSIDGGSSSPIYYATRTTLTVAGNLNLYLARFADQPVQTSTIQVTVPCSQNN